MEWDLRSRQVCVMCTSPQEGQATKPWIGISISGYRANAGEALLNPREWPSGMEAKPRACSRDLGSPYRFRRFTSSKRESFMPRANAQTLSEFQAITGTSQKEAKRYVDRYKRLDAALDAFYSESGNRRAESNVSITKINALFDRYKDPRSDEITVDGTLQLYTDLAVDPDDIVLLAIAYELKSPRVGEWTRRGWIEGLRNLGCDSLESLKNAQPRLRTKLSSDPSYFRAVYNYTFTFSRSEGQRSLAIDIALDYWKILLPFGLSGGALKYQTSSSNDVSSDDKYGCDARYRNHHQDTDVDMDEESEDEDGGNGGGRVGWGNEHTEWWLEYMREKGGRGVSKDTWQMLVDFIQSVDAKFENHDMTAAWPSTIDSFVQWAREKKIHAGCQ